MWEACFFLLYQRVFCCFILFRMSCIRHLSCSYWFLFVSKITHLALLSNGETWVFCGHCTHFPVPHSFLGNILVGPVGWKSLRCSVVFDTSLELCARKQNGSCLSFEDIWEQTLTDASVESSSNMSGRNVRVYPIKFSQSKCVAPEMAMMHGVL